MKIAIGSDHAGYEMKQAIIEHLKKSGHEVLDLGTHEGAKADYPVYGQRVALAVKNMEADLGIVCCGSAEGISMAANKVDGVRCGIGYNDEVTKLLRLHNDANVVAFAGRFMSVSEVLPRVDIFLSTPFEGGRHEIRVEMLKDIENGKIL